MSKNEIVKDVVEQIINMLTNNVIEENGSEGFEVWCEDGEVFKCKVGVKKQDVYAHIKVMEKLAPSVDALSELIDKEMEQE